jgi:hypothetical protein
LNLWCGHWTVPREVGFCIFQERVKSWLCYHVLPCLEAFPSPPFWEEQPSLPSYPSAQQLTSYHLLHFFCCLPPSHCFPSWYLSLAQVSYDQGHHQILPIHSGLDCYAQGS